MNAAIFALKVLISKVYIKFLFSLLENFVPKEGLEPSRLSTLVPKTSVSTIPPPGQVAFYLCAERDSNPHIRWTPPPQDGASTDSAIGAFCFLWPHQDSNLDLKFRKLLFYPLNYGAVVLLYKYSYFLFAGAYF